MNFQESVAWIKQPHRHHSPIWKWLCCILLAARFVTDAMQTRKTWPLSAVQLMVNIFPDHGSASALSIFNAMQYDSVYYTYTICIHSLMNMNVGIRQFGQKRHAQLSIASNANFSSGISAKSRHHWLRFGASLFAMHSASCCSVHSYMLGIRLRSAFPKRYDVYLMWIYFWNWPANNGDDKHLWQIFVPVSDYSATSPADVVAWRSRMAFPSSKYSSRPCTAMLHGWGKAKSLQDRHNNSNINHAPRNMRFW